MLISTFDDGHIDCVVALRPTLSLGLHYRMVSREFCLYRSKTNCLMVGFGRNVARHGPIEQL